MEAKKENERARPKTQIGILIDNISGLFETYLSILEIEVKIRIADALAILIIILMVLLFLAMSLIFLSIGVAFYINHAFDLSTHWGFLIVTLFYIASFFAMLSNRGYVRRKLHHVIEAEEEWPKQIDR